MRPCGRHIQTRPLLRLLLPMLAERTARGPSSKRLSSSHAGSESNVCEVVPTDTAPTVIPAWIGPAKSFVWRKGRAYEFGLLSITNVSVTFASGSGVVFTAPLSGISVTWPRHLAGGGCWIRTHEASHCITFYRPFPDAPGPEAEEVANAAEALGGLGQIASTLGVNVADFITLGTELVENLTALARALRDLKEGRRVAEQIRPLLR